jgi:hypothetical protein
MKKGARVTTLFDNYDAAGKRLVARAGSGATVLSTGKLSKRDRVWSCVTILVDGGTKLTVVREAVRARTPAEDAERAALDYSVQYLDNGPDGQGRRTYFLNWTEGGVRRGQIFNTSDPPPAGARVEPKEQP